MDKIVFNNYSNGESIEIDSAQGLIRLEQLEGANVESEAITYKPIETDGETYISATLKPRTIALDLKIIGRTADGTKYSRSAAVEAYNKLMRAFAVGKVGKLTYTTEGKEYYIECRATATPQKEEITPTFWTVTLYLVADKPLWYEAKEQSVNITSSAIVNIHNDSAVPVPFKLYVKGKDAQPWLLSVTAGAALAMFKGLETSTQHCIIDTAECTCKIYEDDSDTEGELANQYLNAEAEFFYLLPGDNQIFFANYSKGTTVRITWHNGFEGV